EEKMVALMNNSHPLAMLEDKKIDIEELKNEPLIVPSRKAHVEAIKRWFRKLKVEPNIVCEMDNYLDAAALANQGVGVSIFPKTSYVLNNSLVSKELTGDDKKVEYYLVWRKGHLLPTIEENFIDFVKDIYKI
nr:LysR family transcriptional regulator substrate-binding protein [Bacilli bacterium]